MTAPLPKMPENVELSLAGKRILVIEDRLVNQTVIQNQLKALGIIYTLAADGAQALEVLKGNQFDLVLSDCSMPEMDGYDFTRTLRRREKPGQRVPVIALTANDFREDAAKCFEAGMDDFISKPVTKSRLASILGRWLNPLEAPQISADQPQRDAETVAPIDLSILAEILGTDRIETLNQVLTESLATVGKSLSEVEAALSNGDPDLLTGVIRNAKGEARTTAAIGLADLYARLEQCTRGGKRAASRALAVQAATEVGRVEDFIRGHLARQ